jgi:hypothetical protein
MIISSETDPYFRNYQVLFSPIDLISLPIRSEIEFVYPEGPTGELEDLHSARNKL